MKEKAKETEIKFEELKDYMLRFMQRWVRGIFKENKDDENYPVQYFKKHYDQAGLYFKKKDMKEIRENMLRTGRKLYDLHNKRVESMEEDND